MSTYANQTTVTVDKSKQEIEQALRRYGADRFAYAWDRDTNMAAVEFRLNGRTVRLPIRLPQLGDPKLMKTSSGTRRRVSKDAALEQALRQKWRALLLYVKATLEAIENDLVDVDEAFLYAVVLPNNQTVAQFYSPQIDAAVQRGLMPPALPMLTDFSNHSPAKGGT